MEAMASIFRLLSLFLLLTSSAFTSAAALRFPKLGLARGSTYGKSTSQSNVRENLNEGFNIYSYTQTLDHFNYRPDSYSTFQQRYAINAEYWGGAKNNSPIFVYTGDEASLDDDLGVGFLVDNAARFQALLVFIEHRYYGKSNPFGSKRQAYQNSDTLGYFSSTQALADYAQLIVDLKKNMSAQNCPVIAIGGSYGGMLASWFRLKYPHIVIGALASSAPILYFDDITPQNGYFSVVTMDFQEASNSCYRTIRESWSEIDKVASQPKGLKHLSQIFQTCSTLNKTQPLKDLLARIYSECAQYDYPTQRVKEVCSGMDGAAQGATILERISAGVKSWKVNQQCLNVGELDDYNPTPETLSGWDWQTCTEMVMPIGCGSNDTMFEARQFDINNYTIECQKELGTTPRPHWITTEFGGHNITSVLAKFGSNIIFSNGLRDPYSSGGVLHNISDSIVAIYTTQGSHCLDLLPSTADDPKWLVGQRNREIRIIESWISEYNANVIAKINS